MLSCAVVNYHTPDDLHKFVQSWLCQAMRTTELIVIDVEPTEAESTAVAEWLAPLMGDNLIQYWPMDYNCGYSGACNFAATVMEGDVYAFFNADTVLHDDTLRSCYDGIKSNEEWGVLGPLQYDSAGRITAAGIFGTNTTARHRDWRKRVTVNHRDVRDDAITVSGSAIFVKRDCWYDCALDSKFFALYPEAQGGAFLPTPHYYEETWLCYFARHKGWKAIYWGEAEMIHEWHKASPVGSKTEKEYKPKSQKMFRDACQYFGIECD